MDNMDKGLTVPKWVLIVWPKIPQMPQNLFDQFVCPSPKFLDFNENVQQMLHTYILQPQQAQKLQLKRGRKT